MSQAMLEIAPPPGSTITAYMGHMPGTVIYYLMYDSTRQHEVTEWVRKLHEEMILRQSTPIVAPVAEADMCASCKKSIADCLAKLPGTCFNVQTT